MSEKKYTQGKWEARERLNDNVIRLLSTPPGTFQTIQIADVFGTHGKDKANAELIAHAPIMFEYISRQARAGDKEAQAIIANV